MYMDVMGVAWLHRLIDDPVTVVFEGVCPSCLMTISRGKSLGPFGEMVLPDLGESFYCVARIGSHPVQAKLMVTCVLIG